MKTAVVYCSKYIQSEEGWKVLPVEVYFVDDGVRETFATLAEAEECLHEEGYRCRYECVQTIQKTMFYMREKEY